MDAQCSFCDSEDIADNGFCNDCGSVVCSSCGNSEAFDEIRQEDDEYVTYCQDCGDRLSAGHDFSDSL